MDIKPIEIPIVNFTEVQQGDTFGPVMFEYYTSVGGIETAIDISSDDFLINVVDPKKKNLMVLQFTVGSGLTIQNTNQLVMSKPAAEMLAVPPGIYIQELERTQLSGVVSTDWKGTFIVKEDIS